MKDETKFLIEIADKFGKEAQNVLDFVVKSGNLEKAAKALIKTEVTESQDGIYLVYADGHAELFNGENTKRNVTYIGVVFQGHRFGVSLTEIEAALLPEDTQPTKRATYKTECESIYNFDSADNTARLVEDNPELANYLKPGEAIPALGVLIIMCNLREDINRALEYVGGQQLTDEYYWSSAEYSENCTWCVGFSSGYVNNGSKYYDLAVRAVAAF